MKRTLSCLLVLTLLLSLFTFSASAAGRKIITTPTGYTSASDVDYVTRNQGGKTVVVNWGARGEDCLFLSTYADDYYVGSYTYESLSSNSGGSTQSNASNSNLYRALQSMMKLKHSYITSYDATKSYYQYTDCVSNNYGTLSSFYSGKIVNGSWDGGKTYNREHTWPNSKGLGGSDENDIMMLRPTIPSENGSRGNTAYGESSGYFDPGVDVRGDCARIALYVYTRWGNTSYMWGKSGVIENLDILLKWMEEDPVDTWEMGRNDSVQSITGVRNVFIDYPEFAWLLFGEDVPDGVTTPSGSADSGSSTCSHSQTKLVGVANATCTTDGYTGDTRCSTCNKKLSSGSTVSATGHKDNNGDKKCDTCGTSMETPSTSGTHFVKVTKAPTDWSGTYLIVFENSSWALDGSLGKLEATNNYVEVTIKNGTIDTDAKYAFVIESVSGGYTIKSSSGYYIGHTGSNNALTASQSDKMANTLSVNSNGEADITSGGFYLRFNANDDQNRFRYYKSSTYTNQQPIALYKLTSGGTATHSHSWGTGTVTTQPSCETPGVKTYTCSSCKQTKTEAIAATGHATETRNQKKATCIAAGYTGDNYCDDCGKKLSTGTSIPATGHTDANKDNVCDTCKANLSGGCIHPNVATSGAKAPTCTEAGYTGDTYCEECDAKLSTGTSIPATGHVDTSGDQRCDTCGDDMNAATEDPSVPPTEESVPPTTGGITTTVPATGPATVPSEDIPAMNTGSDSDDSSPAIWIVIGVVILLAAGITVFIILKKKKATEE